MGTVDAQIRSIGANISGNIDALGHDRGLLAQNLLSQLRNLVEAIAVRFHLRDGDAEFHYNATGPAIDWIGSATKQLNFLHRFHKLLQMSASHYTFEGDASERLMLKYYEYLLRTRALLNQQCGVDILGNLERFPVDLDPSLRIYHQKIAERIEAATTVPADLGSRNRYYVNRVRPFFTGGRIYYEVTFSNISDKLNKSDRIIAFTDIDMTDKYAANLTLLPVSIDVLGQTMPITIIKAWEVSIRPCEFDNFARILGHTTKVGSSLEYRNLMRFLTDSSASLVDLMDMPDARYDHIRSVTLQRVQKPQVFPVLDTARAIIRAKSPGTNVLRYLMLSMNNRVIKLQFDTEACKLLSNLRLSYSCKPFDEMPFCTSPRQHNPRFADLAASLDITGRTHELLARRVQNNVERHGMLYTPASELEDLGPVNQLVDQYNSKVYYKHTGRKLLQDKGQVFMRQYEDGTVSIIETLQEYAESGVEGYSDAVEKWLSTTQLNVDDDVKKAALQSLFDESRVALIYGAAGTGKSTMVNYIANYFGDKQKLFLAHTNPAKDNLQRKVSAQNTEFRTIRSQTWRAGIQPDYDVLVIDECSTVSNSDLLAVLQNTSFKLLVLVGDVYQIESIQFGNWFSIIRSFVPKESVFELTKPYRTDSESLLDFWSKVRHLEDGVEESIAQNGYSAVLGQSLFRNESDDEIILCLNYDGLYGINNVNRFLQSSNPARGVAWGATIYKAGDPVLFNETDRFKPLIFNNLKGRIVDVQVQEDHVQFDIWLDRSVTELDAYGLDLEFVGNSTVRFTVNRAADTDDDQESTDTAVPFQVAYAVSIHKAQGLEYDSVKVVITDANEDDISHSIFYTAITRTCEGLRIFWTPETQRAVLSNLNRTKSGKDVALLRARRGLN
ncbi:AAA family ATPase [Paenarthrobacter nitroguajacolicus]|uniref:AAA family ATPase n=1 Tax=Paenarthrobacter nitroguajacolicus TaxID=211146 RepID=A0A558GYX4_PAENT|nr:ATP-dependent RecD-like DNA helicase [Paenarthrobacter nitroguajacolicus]TVU62032.1 AAA family ATPase [Paenarthrobacter nitroguajacolicus]